VGAALLEEFGRGDARAREESWRYSKMALRALAQQEFVAAGVAPDVAGKYSHMLTRCFGALSRDAP